MVEYFVRLYYTYEYEYTFEVFVLQIFLPTSLREFVYVDYGTFIRRVRTRIYGRELYTQMEPFFFILAGQLSNFILKISQALRAFTVYVNNERERDLRYKAFNKLSCLNTAFVDERH